MVNTSEYMASLDKMRGGKVLIIGDVMLDHYVIGDVGRISPEAPVPVVRVDDEYYRLGGAGNVARNIRALGGDPWIVGVCGPDAQGRVVKDLLEEERVRTTLIEDPSRPTTRKTRIIARNQQVVRVDRECDDRVPGDVLESLLDHVRGACEGFPVIIVSDYGKGIVCQRFMDSLSNLRTGSGERPLILVDPKTVNYPVYDKVDLLTPNAKEAGEGAGFEVRGKQDAMAAGRALLERLNARHMLVTLGAEGMALFESGDKIHHIPTSARKVFDVTGAGDTVIATLGLALSAGIGLLEACVLSNYAAGIVVGQVGAAVATVENLKKTISTAKGPDVTRWA